MMGLLLHEAAEIGLRPEQQSSFDGVKAELEKLRDSSKDARAQLQSDLADGAAAGKLDKAKIDADTKKLVAAEEASVKSLQDSINKLQKALDSEQRKKLVEAWKAKAERMGEHGMGMGPGQGPGEHAKGPHEPREHGKGPGGHEGHHGSGAPEMGPHGAGPHGAGPHDPVAKLGDELALSPEQREKLKTKLDALMKSHQSDMKNHRAEMQKHFKALADAFQTDKFDAKRVGVGAKFGAMAKMMTKHGVDFIEAVLSVLTPEQRSKFAEHVRQHEQMRPH
jgi:Spy/CpxP family protein refolding chaperone